MALQLEKCLWNRFDRGSPDKGLGWRLLKVFEEIPDYRLEDLGDAVKDAAPDALVSEFPKPALDEVEPGSASGREV